MARVEEVCGRGNMGERICNEIVVVILRHEFLYFIWRNFTTFCNERSVK